jgi:50S ribosomal protein L16 3-hydroxylase
MKSFFNTGLTQQQFLDEYWQKKPLLIRQAWDGFEPLLTAEELAGLACDEDIESRLFIHDPDKEQW